MSNENKKYPLTVCGLYTTSGSNSRSAILKQDQADRMCAAIQSAVGGKIAVKATNPATRAAKQQEAEQRGEKSTFPDYFLEAVTPDLLAEERARMAEQNPNKGPGANAIPSRVAQTFASGDDAL